MARLKLGISGLNVVELVEKGHHVHDKLEENSVMFPAPPVGLGVFKTKVEDLFSYFESAKTNREFIPLRNETEEIVRGYLRALGNYVADISNGNAVKFVAGGFSEVQPITPIGPVEPPQGMVVDFKKGFSTELFIRWKSAKGASNYQLEMATEENPNDFQFVASVTQVRYTVQNLVPGKTYFFRCTSFGSAGKGGTTPVVSCMAI